MRRTIREARKNRGGVSRRAAATLVATMLTVGLLGGYAMAATLTMSTVTQHAASYGSASSTVPNWPYAPALAVATVPAGASSCSTSASLGSVAPGTAVVVSPNSSAGKCAAGDFAENWTFAPAASLAGETDRFTVSASWATAGGLYSASVTLSLAVAAGSDGAGYPLYLYVDFGPVAPLSVDTLAVIVS